MAILENKSFFRIVQLKDLKIFDVTLHTCILEKSPTSSMTSRENNKQLETDMDEHGDMKVSILFYLRYVKRYFALMGSLEWCDDPSECCDGAIHGRKGDIQTFEIVARRKVWAYMALHRRVRI